MILLLVVERLVQEGLEEVVGLPDGFDMCSSKLLVTLHDRDKPLLKPKRRKENLDVSLPKTLSN
jgi:hypothetical protein